MLKTLNDHLAERSPESSERINRLAEALAHAIPMYKDMNRICPSCKEGIVFTSLQDITPFHCHHCGQHLYESRENTGVLRITESPKETPLRK